MPIDAGPASVCCIELFGLARLAAGVSKVLLPLRGPVTLSTAVSLLAKACPGLVGKAIRDDGGALMDGYVLNFNGLSFVDDPSATISPGDRLLLLSDQAGG